MGILKGSFPFLLGTGCGIYIAQNYDIPNIKKLVKSWLGEAKQLEEKYKKPNKNKDNE